MILEDQNKNNVIELTEKQKSLKTNTPSDAEMRKHEAEIKLLENKLEQNLTKFNDLKSHNKGLRKSIDVMRK